jgi:RimJ/RimL family protein N-acetyltransferase
MRGATVRLRPLQAADFKMLHRWHQAPHLRPFYVQADITPAEIERKFAPRLAPDHSVRCRIATMDGMPFGFIQWYPNRHWTDCGAMRVGLRDGCSADYFIGNAAFLGLGLAPRMLRTAADEVFAAVDPADALLCLAHDDRNTAAVRATCAAGFRPEATYDDEGHGHTVYVTRAPR